MANEGQEFIKEALASLLAKMDVMTQRIESLEKGASSTQGDRGTPSAPIEKGTPSVQIETGEGSSSPTFTPEQVVELLNQQRVKEDRERIERTGIPRILDNPPRNFPLPRPVRNVQPLEQVVEAQEGEEVDYGDDMYGFDDHFQPRRAMNWGRNVDRGRGRGRGPPLGYGGRNARRDYVAYDDHHGGQPEPFQGGRDNNNNLNSVKLTIPSFKGSSD